MGSLKDEKRGLGEDHQPLKKSDNRGHQAGSGSSAAAEGHQRHASQQSTSQEKYQPNLHMSASSEEERDKTLISKDEGLSGVDGGISELSVSERAKACAQTDVMPMTQQPAAYETTATQDDAAVIINPQSHGDPENKSDREKVPVPPTPDTSDPRSPAPFGQQHMRTQVSLEVVQCHSAATSPMTPPEGSHSFFFPSTFVKCEGVAADTKDAELQVGQQVKFCSVATSPMTPKTPSTTAFPMLVGKETVQKGMRKDKKQNHGWEQGSFAATQGQMETESGGSSISCLAPGSVHSQGTEGTCEDGSQQYKQQRMGSMDQDITILVTQHGNNEEEDENMADSHFPPVEPEMVKTEEYEQEKCEDKKEAPEKSNQKQYEEPKDCSEAENSELTENKGTGEKVIDISGTKPPESPAPFGCHNIRTQVSLEVVQCHSIATSPMTPPEGDQAFYFPSSFGKCGSDGTETKDAELQVGQQVEFRSVATAPMTPRTPVATTFPEIKTEVSIEEKILEEKEEEEMNKKEQLMECQEKKCKEEEEKKEEDKSNTNCLEEDEEKSEEPVQEVSWDEKGMTWEVYGAVVEVAVLGSAIQKHLEKQVLKQKQQSSVTPLEPSEVGQVGSGKGRARKKEEEDGKGSRRRRNPFRGLMENVQQPHCCTRAHTSE